MLNQVFESVLELYSQAKRIDQKRVDDGDKKSTSRAASTSVLTLKDAMKKLEGTSTVH